MLQRKLYTILSVFFLSIVSLTWGCAATRVKGPLPTKTNLRSLEETPDNSYLGIPMVNDFLAACDILARDLVMSAAVQTTLTPLVMEIRPIENKTGEEIDLTIYPQTIRGMINRQGVRNIIFRDEKARDQIIDERIGQSDDAILVSSHSETSTSKRSRPSSIRSKYGVGTLPPTQVGSTDSGRTFDHTTEVSGKVAEVDYFLNGFIYATNEMSVGANANGFRYFQFQFRLTNAKSGLVAWESMYQVKRAGVLTSAPR